MLIHLGPPNLNRKGEQGEAEKISEGKHRPLIGNADGR